MEKGGNGDGRLRERTAKMTVVARTSRMAARMAKKVEDQKAMTMAKDAKHEQDFGVGTAAISAGRGPERAAEAQRRRWA